MDEQDSGGRFPFTSFPDGWFFFELSRNMPPGKLVGKQWMGRQVVGWRNRAGRILRSRCVLSSPGRACRPPTLHPRRPAGSTCFRSRRSTASSSPGSTRRRVFRTRRYPKVDGKAEREVKLRIMGVLFSDVIPAPRDIVIISLSAWPTLAVCLESCWRSGSYIVPRNGSSR